MTRFFLPTLDKFSIPYYCFGMVLPEDTLPSPALRRRFSRSLLTVGAIFACALLTVLGLAAFAGYQAGLDQRETLAAATQTADLQVQFDRGSADLAAGRYAIAAERFAYILQIDPNYSGAADKLAQAQRGLQITPSPTPPATTPTPAGVTPAETFDLAQSAYAEANWDGVIAHLAHLRAVDANYEAAKVTVMMFAALRSRGMQRILGNELEAGIVDLDQAKAFGTLDQEALNHRAWARLYLDALTYWGLNWGKTADILAQLYPLAPNFHDTTRKYFQASANYGDELSAMGDACGAADHYATAAALFADARVAEKLAAAQASCPTSAPTASP